MIYTIFNGSPPAVYLVPAAAALLLALGNPNVTQDLLLTAVLAFLYRRWNKKGQLESYIERWR